MDLTNEAYDIINRYFSILEHTGYKVYSEVEKMIVFLFIEEMLTGPLSEYITDEDYANIDNSLNCLYGTCLLPFPTYKKAIDNIRNNGFEQYRITQDNILRTTKDSNLRVKS